MSERGKCQVCSSCCESRCSLCRTVYYCSKSHQKSDWHNHKESCTKKKFKIDRNDNLGRFLVATEDIKADYILFKDKPLVLAPKGLLDVDDIMCLSCFKTLHVSDSSSDAEENENERDDYSCPKCSLPICSSNCSSQYFHSYFECKLLNEAAIASISPQDKGNADQKVETASSARVQDDDEGPVKTKYNNENEARQKRNYSRELKEALIQHLLYFRCLLLKHVNGKHWEMMMDLQSNNEHRDDLGNLEKTARVFEEMKNTLAQIGHPTIKTISKPDLHKVLGILETNAADIKIGTKIELIGLFPTFSMVEYSCFPTAKYYFVPPTQSSGKKSKATYELICRSTIPLNSGDHISVVATNILWNTSKRREELKKTKYFLCNCRRCISPTELESNFSTILCPLNDCKSLSVPVPKPNSDMGEVQWKCLNAKCGKTCESWQVKKVDSKLSEIIGKMTPSATIQNYKEVLRQFEQLVHPDYYLNFIVNHLLIQMQGRDETTRNDKDMLEDKLTTCNRLLGIIKKLDPGLAKLNIFQAVIYFEMHAAILALSGGEGDEDYEILRKQPETVKLGRVYLQKCIDCFQYELLNPPETKLKVLAEKKIAYLNLLIKYS